LLAWQDRTADSGRNTLLATDEANSVLAAGFNPLTTITYSPYGHRESAALPPGLPGFNGEPPDPLTGHYLLGNGYRAFNPVLMRFNSPDNLSPFEGGGLNAYAYCLGDPINRADPTGHWGWLIGGLMAGALGAGVAHVATRKTNQEVSSALGVLALGLGVASAMVLGAGALAAFKNVGNKVAGRFSQGLSGRGAMRKRFDTAKSDQPRQLTAVSPEQLAARHEKVALEQVQGRIRELRPNEVSKYLKANPQDEAYVKKLSAENLKSYVGSPDDHVEWLVRLNRAHTGRGRGFLNDDLATYPAQRYVVEVLRSMGKL
jgi:RHS repeat-associated protein